MYDATHLAGIPKPILANSLVAYYLDGPFAVKSVQDVVNMFPPDITFNPIDVLGTRANYARTVDCETLDVPADQLEQWVQDFGETNPEYENGARAVVYSNRDNIADVRTGTGRYILGRDYYLWVATGDGTIVTAADLGLPANSVIACQNEWLRLYDTSVVFSAQFLPN
jgi:hypothetical protein